MAHIGIDARLWTKTGVGRYIRNLSIALAKDKGVQSHTFSLFALSEDKRLLPDFPNNFQIVKADYYWHSISEQIGFAKLLNSVGADLVHFTYSPAPFLYKRPFVMTVHDLIMIKFKTGKASTLPYPMYALKHNMYSRLLKRSLKKSRGIIVPTNAVKKELMEDLLLDEAKISVTYEGFDEGLRRGISLPSSLREKKYFLYVGNAYPHKNIETLISAFELFRSKNPEFALVLVGKKDFFYERLSKKFNLYKGKSIIHLDDVDDVMLSTLYLKAQAFVTASMAEGFGLPVLESLSHGTPVVVSNIPVFHEVGIIGTVFFDPRNVEALAKSMEYVVKQSSVFRKEIGKDKGILSKQFSWDQLARQTVEVYENCIGL